MSHEPKNIDTVEYPPFEAYNGSDPYLFVSYAHKDSISVFSDMRWLNDKGYRVWYDEGIEPGHDWPEEIALALGKCLVFLVFISPRAVESHNVRNEINLAIKRRKPLIAIHIEPTDLPPGLELRLGHIQAIMKYALPEDRYRRKIERVLPPTILQPRSEGETNKTAVGAIEPASPVRQPTPIPVSHPKRISGEGTRPKSDQPIPMRVNPLRKLREDEARAEKIQPRLVEKAPTPRSMLEEESRAKSAQPIPMRVVPLRKLLQDEARLEKVQPRLVKRVLTTKSLLEEEVRATVEPTKSPSEVSPPKRLLDQETSAKRKCVSEMISLISYPAQQLVNVVSAVPRNVVSEMSSLISYPAQQMVNVVSAVPRNVVSEMSSLISYPVQQLVNVVSSVPRNVVFAVDQTTRLRHGRLG